MLDKYYKCPWCNTMNLAQKIYGAYIRVCKCRFCGFGLEEQDAIFFPSQNKARGQT